MTIKQTAYYIIEKYSDISAITPLKLQKLLYYLHVWGIISGKKVFSEQFEKWKHGPVNPDIYTEFKHFGHDNIKLNEDQKLKYAEIDDSQIDNDFIDLIIKSYIKYDAITLSALTHSDAPWKDTKQNSIISENAIADYYKNLSFAKNFIDNEKGYYYPVETDFSYSYILDKNSDAASEPYFFESFEEYLKLEKEIEKEFYKYFTKEFYQDYKPYL